MREISFTLNGLAVSVWARGDERLLDVLRGPLDQKGTKEGCGQGECGACTVLVDDRSVNACLYPIFEIEGRRVTTIEGLGGATKQDLGPVQRAFVEAGAIQCGFCSPGMIVQATALLRRDPDPSEAAIRDALRGNLCRCTGYQQIVQAVRLAAAAGAGAIER